MPVGRQHADRRVARAGGAHVTRRRVDGEADHGHERPARELAERDLVRLGEELAGAWVEPDERAEDELRERHVGRRRDSVAARVSEHDGELPVGQGQEVVDVAADIDLRRRLVDGADLEPLDFGQPAGEQRALHRVREVLLLLVETRVVDRERGLTGDEECRLDRVLPDPVRRVERDHGQRRQQLRRGRDRDDDRSRSLLEERHEQLVRRSEALRAPGVEDERPAHPEEAASRKLLDGLVLREQRAQRPLEARVGHVHRTGDELVAAPVLHPDHRRVGLEQLDGGARHGIEGRVERQALGERPRDLVQRPQALRRLAFRGERLLALRGEALGSLVQLGVLRRHRQLVRERREERRLVRRQLPPARQVRGEQAHELLAGDERHGERRLDAGAADTLTNRGQPRVGPGVLDVHHPVDPAGAERELEQPLGDHQLRVGELAAGRRAQPEPLADVDGHAVRAEQLRDARDRRLQRVRQRELGDRLAHDFEQGLSVLQLHRHLSAHVRPRAVPARRGRKTRRASRARLARARRPLRRRAAARRAEGVQGPASQSVRRDPSVSASTRTGSRSCGSTPACEGAAASDSGGPAVATSSSMPSSPISQRSAASAPAARAATRTTSSAPRAWSSPAASASPASARLSPAAIVPVPCPLPAPKARRTSPRCAAASRAAAISDGSKRRVPRYASRLPSGRFPAPAGTTKHAAGANQATCPANRLGKTFGRRSVLGELGERETRPGKLGGERFGAAEDGAHAEHPVLVGDPDRDRVGSQHLGESPPQAVERLAEPTLVSRPPPRCGERLEPLLGDAVHKPHGKVSPTGIAR